MFAFNNVDNPFKESPIPYNTHDFEREVIQRFGKRYAFPSDDTWGFLSHSGTDSNMHGMYMGRMILKGRTGRLPKAYFTKEASRFPELDAVRANTLSNTIYFKNPGDRIVEKYSLATIRLEMNRQPQDYAHAVVMPHVNRQVIEAFMNDSVSDLAKL